VKSLKVKSLEMKTLFIAILFVANLASAADDIIYLEETVISGNQELPKVLYILPWREMAAESLPVRTLHYEESSVMAPVYPADHRRELGYRERLKQLSQLDQPPQVTTTKGE
jgi:hypothetical protein